MKKKLVLHIPVFIDKSNTTGVLEWLSGFPYVWTSLTVCLLIDVWDRNVSLCPV